ncbi:hypothetical protein O6P43_029437 [Quillaja saponaria]|uniref:Uncharacterized protein n=1 Tax=Quillaja saponaria TaxID=32244 RepID=A0AAD7PBF3_QUISA|nr:hypothetical protein O6P43_029437 [Quillaja saponaria]
MPTAHRRKLSSPTLVKAEKGMRTAIHNVAATVNELKEDLSEAIDDIKALKANMDQVYCNIELLLKKCCRGRPVDGGGTPLGKASGMIRVREVTTMEKTVMAETAVVMIEALIRLN